MLDRTQMHFLGAAESSLFSRQEETKAVVLVIGEGDVSNNGAAKRPRLLDI